MALKKGDVRTEDEKLWDYLADQIWAGNVIPVIGDNLVVEGTTIASELISYLAEDKNLRKTPRTFSELYYDKDFVEHQKDLYEEVSALIKVNQADFYPTQILRDFLSIEQFPFVITTSVDYTVEETMKEIWGQRGKKVRSLVFCNDPKLNDDIRNDDDIKDPTVYYMFGKADKKREHSFVLTEEDMLLFCKSWLSESHPQLLSKLIGSKYLLFLGVNYPDWLIRFVWYSMRNNLKESGVLLNDRELEGSLTEFFQRVSIKTQNEPMTVINQLIKRLAAKKKEFEDRRFDTIPEGMDFFISYSRRDEAYAAKLYDTLISHGYSAWYDRKDLAVGYDWEPLVRRGIRTSKKFIALISETVVSESNEPHVYHSEWDIALAHRLKDLGFVVPVCIGSVNYDEFGPMIPDDIKHIHSESWDNDVELLVSKLFKLL